MASAVVAAVTVFSTVKSFQEKKAARKDEKEASRISQKKTDIQNAKANRRRLAAARVARAQTVAQGVGAGIGGSSVIAGAAGAVVTQGAANVGFQNQLAGLDRARFSALDSAAGHTARAETFSAIGGLGSQLGFGNIGEQFTAAQADFSKIGSQ